MYLGGEGGGTGVGLGVCWGADNCRWKMVNWLSQVERNIQVVENVIQNEAAADNRDGGGIEYQMNSTVPTLSLGSRLSG